MVKKLIAVLAVAALVVAGGGQVASAERWQGYDGNVCGEGETLLAKYEIKKKWGKVSHWNWGWVYSLVPVFGDEVVAAEGDRQSGSFEVADDTKVVIKVVVKTLYSQHEDEYDPGVTEGTFDNGDPYRQIEKVKFCGKEAPKDVQVCRDGQVVTIKDYEQLETDLPADDPSCQPKEEEEKPAEEKKEEGVVLSASTTTPPASLPKTGSDTAAIAAVVSAVAAAVLVASAAVRRVYSKI